MHIAIDLDEVVLDFVGGIVNSVNVEYGSSLTYDDIVGWDLAPVLDPILEESWWGWMKKRDWLWGNVFEAVHGAIGGLYKLHRAGHYIEIVTAKPDWARHSVSQWIGKWRPYYDSLTIIGMDQSKSDVTDAILLIDDRDKNLTQWVESDPDRVALRFVRSWNSSMPPHDRIYTTDGWLEVVDTVTRVAVERGWLWS